MSTHQPSNFFRLGYSTWAAECGFASSSREAWAEFGPIPAIISTIGPGLVDIFPDLACVHMLWAGVPGVPDLPPTHQQIARAGPTLANSEPDLARFQQHDLDIGRMWTSAGQIQPNSGLIVFLMSRAGAIEFRARCCMAQGSSPAAALARRVRRRADRSQRQPARAPHTTSRSARQPNQWRCRFCSCQMGNCGSDSQCGCDTPSRGSSSFSPPRARHHRDNPHPPSPRPAAHFPSSSSSATLLFVVHRPPPAFPASSLPTPRPHSSLLRLPPPPSLCPSLSS